MRRIQSVVLAAIAAIGLAGAASAADMAISAPIMPVLYNWTGAYVGAEGGWARSSQDWTSTTRVTTGNFTGNGGLFGATLGYNYQSNRFVGGLEGDVSWADLNATDTTTGGCKAAFPCKASTNLLATVRGRLGLAADRWLFYVTGGGAFVNVRNDQFALSPFASTSSNKAGWTVGGGVEAAVWDKWTAKAEYLHANVGQTPFCPVAGCGFAVSNYTRLDIVRVGLNYKFY